MCGANELVLSRKLSTWPNRPPVLWGEEERGGTESGDRGWERRDQHPDTGRCWERGQRGAGQAEVTGGTSALRVSSVWGNRLDTSKNCRVPDIRTGMWGVGSLEPGVWRKGSSPTSESHLESGTGHQRVSLGPHSYE